MDRPRDGSTAARLIAFAALALLAAPAATASWSQSGGVATRDGLAPLGELDVVGQARLVPDGVTFDSGGAGVVDTGRELLALGTKGGQCTIVQTSHDGLDARATSTFDCPLGADLGAWADPYALVCLVGSSLDPLLQAWLPGASEPAWTHVPQSAVPDAASLLTTVGQDANAWTCRSVAVTGQDIYVAFSSVTGRNRIERLSLADGSVQWSTAIPSSVFLQGVNASALPPEVLDASGAFRAEAITVTNTGVVVTGRLDGTQVSDAPPGVAWLTREGELRGAYVTSLGPGTPMTTTQPALLPQSRWPASQGNLGATFIGDALFAVNPRLGQGTATTIGNPSLGQNVLAGPCWARDHIFVPGEAAGFVVPVTDPSAFARWPGLTGGRVQACAVQDTTVWVLLSRDEDGASSDLVQVDLATAKSIVRVPLPMRPSDPLALAMGIVPLADGTLIAYDGTGLAAWLRGSATAPMPELASEDDYPGASEPAAVNAALPAGAPNGTRLLLAWADGRLEDVEPGRYSHTYGEGGDRIVRLTAVYPDNRTATTKHALHVGAASPPPQTILDILLAPENQNYTFTTIGILITVITAVLGAVGVHRGRHRLERHMAHLDRLHEAGRRDPFATIHDLHEFREDRRADLAKGSLDQGQYTVLEAAADRALQILRQRILGRYVGKVSDRFTHQLDVALADGALDDEEAKGLLAAVSSESALNKAERERLSAMVRAWNKAI